MWSCGCLDWWYASEWRQCVSSRASVDFTKLFHLMMRRFGQWLPCLPGSQSDHVERLPLLTQKGHECDWKINLCCLKLLRLGDCSASFSWLEARRLIGCYETFPVILSLWYHLLISGPLGPSSPLLQHPTKLGQSQHVLLSCVLVIFQGSVVE